MAFAEKAVSLPFTIGPTGSVVMTDDQSKIWADRVVSVIGTAIGERIHNYYFGSRIHEQLWKTEEEAVEGLDESIAKSFEDNLPLLDYSGITTEYDSTLGSLTVTISYRLPNDVQENVTVGSVTIQGDSPIKEY